MNWRWLQSCGAVVLFLLLPSVTPGDRRHDVSTIAEIQSSYLLRASVVGSAGYAGTSPQYQLTGTLGQSIPVGDGMAMGKVSYAGFWGAAWTPTPVTVDIAIECPPDSMIPGYSTVYNLVLSGFRITNQSSISLLIGYNLTTTGTVLDLVDNGNPTSLLGATPPLAPGVSFSPPEAALEIPAIREWVDQEVDYEVSPVGSPGFKDSCKTVITIEPPVTTFISSFEARPHVKSVELAWEISTDEQIKGFRLYRRDHDVELPLTTDQLIPPEKRDYLDSDVHSSTTYRYILSVVREDESEIRSQSVTVKTKNYPFALHQNYPNPFNPVTTISFTLPTRTRVSLSIFNVEGELIKTLVDRVLDGGMVEVNWDGLNARGNPVCSGVYLYRLKAGAKILTKKMVLLK